LEICLKTMEQQKAQLLQLKQQYKLQSRTLHQLIGDCNDLKKNVADLRQYYREACEEQVPFLSCEQKSGKNESVYHFIIPDIRQKKERSGFTPSTILEDLDLISGETSVKGNTFHSPLQNVNLEQKELDHIDREYNRVFKPTSKNLLNSIESMERKLEIIQSQERPNRKLEQGLKSLEKLLKHLKKGRTSHLKQHHHKHDLTSSESSSSSSDISSKRSKKEKKRHLKKKEHRNSSTESSSEPSSLQHELQDPIIPSWKKTRRKSISSNSAPNTAKQRALLQQQMFEEIRSLKVNSNERLKAIKFAEEKRTGDAHSQQNQIQTEFENQKFKLKETGGIEQVEQKRQQIEEDLRLENLHVSSETYDLLPTT